MENIIKYPRTPHLQGSNLQKGDEDLNQIPFDSIKGKYLVIEEKIDGANCGVSFSSTGELLLQSRGHFLRGGYRERHYDLFKTWAYSLSSEFYQVLGTRYLMYGEWLYAKHKIYYDSLPSYFMEFDIYDKENKVFLSTERRREMLKNLPVHSVPVLGTGRFKKSDEVLKYLGNSLYKSENWEENFKSQIEKLGLDLQEQLLQSDNSPLMEGLYIKIEEDGEVVDRLKYVRNSFNQGIQESDTPWLNRVIIPNGLKR